MGDESGQFIVNVFLVSMSLMTTANVQTCNQIICIVLPIIWHDPIDLHFTFLKCTCTKIANNLNI